MPAINWPVHVCIRQLTIHWPTHITGLTPANYWPESCQYPTFENVSSQYTAFSEVRYIPWHIYTTRYEFHNFLIIKVCIWRLYLALWCAAQKILSSLHLCFHGWNKKQRTTALRVPLKSSGSLVDLYLQNTDSISSVFRWQIRGFICGLAFRLGQNVPHGSLTWSHQSFVGGGTQVSVSFLRFPKHWPGQVSRDICSCEQTRSQARSK